MTWAIKRRTSKTTGLKHETGQTLPMGGKENDPGVALAPS